MSRNTRAVILGGAISLAAWLLLRGVPNTLAMLRETELAVRQRADLLARARDEVRNLARLSDSISSLDGVAASLPGMLLMGGDAETAAVDLMRRVRELIDPEHVVLTGFESFTVDERSGPLALAAIEARIETDFAGLLETIDRIEGDTALALERIEVEAADAHAPPEAPERLLAELSVSGWFRPHASEAVAGVLAR